jgi:two-component system, cell cycle sensor histidine kinase and response regulator CckA
MERTDFEQWKAKEVARLLALVETERRYYQEMVAALPVPLVVLSADRSIISANRAFRQTFGVRMEELRRKTIEQILPAPQLLERIRDIHTLGGVPRDLFIELDQRSLRVAVVPIRNWDEDGEPETLLMVQDITAFGAPAPVRATPVLDIPAIVWQADSASRTFKSVSGAVERLLGFPASHWLETPQFFSERIHADDRSETMDFYAAAIQRGGDATAEFRVISASGQVVWCRETIRVTKEDVTGVLTDITRRKQLEQQLFTAERTDALQGLASRLAHDLNNPLMIITGYGEEMLHTLQPEDPLRTDVEQILGATERISGITGQLLGFTRRLANPATSVDLGAIIAGLEGRIAQAVGESVAVEIGPPSNPVWASADRVQLEEAVLALASEGREESQARTHIAISSGIEAIFEHLPGATLQAGMYACLTIREDGHGLDPERLAAVFESVLAGKESATPALARAYANIRAWGGDIAVSSEVSKGLAFTIYLPEGEPVKTVAAPVVEATEPPVETPPAEPAEQLRETILLVEDEAGIRALVRKILRRERYDVLEAGSAEEALSIAGTHPGQIRLLLTDVMLPGMGGRDLAEALRRSFADLKVLYVSGYTEDESVRAGAFPPGSRFLQKPFTLSVLVGKVREALDADAAE